MAGQKLEQHFGIAARAEAVAEGLQLAAQDVLVVDLTVEHQDIASAGRAHRLASGGGEVLDGQAPMQQGGLPAQAIAPNIPIIRAAVVEGLT
jgi:hypothetical protein